MEGFMNIKIGIIPSSEFYDYRLDVMFDGYKWDIQAQCGGSQGTISNQVILLERDTAAFLADCAVELYNETTAMERALMSRPDLAVKMGISQEMAKALCSCNYNPNNHIRLMRFDFHPTTDGWQISEVNSDVPAGYPEASVLPQLAEKYFSGYRKYGDFGEVLADRFTALALRASTIVYLHDTHTVEDYQILHFLGDLLEKRGFRSRYADPSHIKWQDYKAVDTGAIMRYYPVEWLEFHEGADWRGFVNSKTPSCNHPIALLTQSKRLPLVWNELDCDIPFWKKLLPQTLCASSYTRFKNRNTNRILKPAFGRVGEGINIPGAVSKAENSQIKRAAKTCCGQWVVQKMFDSLPVDGLHLNLGVFVVDGKFAGLYGRASKIPRIDSGATELPVLVKEDS
jgi:glutathionylspermidine synthase